MTLTWEHECMNGFYLWWWSMKWVKDLFSNDWIGLVEYVCSGLDHFCLWMVSNLVGKDLSKCWRHSSEILVNIDVTASHTCCSFDDPTQLMPKTLASTPLHQHQHLSSWTSAFILSTSSIKFLRWFKVTQFSSILMLGVNISRLSSLCLLVEMQRVAAMWLVD